MSFSGCAEDEDPPAAMCARVKGVAFQRKREGEFEAN